LPNGDLGGISSGISHFPSLSPSPLRIQFPFFYNLLQSLTKKGVGRIPALISERKKTKKKRKKEKKKKKKKNEIPSHRFQKEKEKNPFTVEV